MRKLSLILGIVFCASFTLLAQTKAEAKEKAIVQIAKMKTGIIFVRLSDRAPAIKALKDKGMERRARIVKFKQEKINSEIIAAFDEFDFCKVYFFYSSDSELIRKREFSKAKIYHSLDSIVKGVTVDTNFFVADFGMLINESKSTTKSKLPEQSGISKDKTYKGGTINTNMKCMYFRDHTMKQMTGPFPFYVRFNPSPIRNLSNEQVVKRMDKQLTEFYTEFYY